MMFRHRHTAPRWLQALIKRRIRRKLQLDGQQVQELDALHHTLQQTCSEMHQLRRDAMGQLQQLLQQPQLEHAAIERLLAIPGKFMEDHRAEVAQAIGRFLNGLRPEQRQRLASRLQHHGNSTHA